MPQEKARAGAASQIREILGPVDDEVVIDIVNAGATAAEVSEAFEWLNDDDYMGAELNRSMNKNVQRVYDILRNDRDRMGPDDE
jgi:hypothetical protein